MAQVSFWNRRNRTIVIGAVPVIALVSLLGMPRIPGTDIDLTVPYAAEGKGPTFNTLGDVDGRPVVQIEGEKPDKTTGHLNMTTVSVRTNMTFAQAMSRWLTTDDTLVPIEQVLPSGKSQEEVREQNAAAFAASESNATISAMNYLKRPLETMVVNVREGSPAADVIKVNDIITKIDDQKVTLPDDLAKLVQEHKPGEDITVTVLRQSREKTFTVKLAETPKKLLPPHTKGPVAFLGVTSVAQPSGDLKVKYNLTDIGGPSAGLMFSMAVVDKLSPDNLTDGKFVAGTGTIDAEGKVGPIGGITHKIAAAKDAGATVFLVPDQNCKEAVTGDVDGITLLKVDSLSDAINDLKTYNSGGNASTCQAG